MAKEDHLRGQIELHACITGILAKLLDNNKQGNIKILEYKLTSHGLVGV